MPVFMRPSVLISSTIYDFSDLRSALRFWLTELGYEVMLSEFNDFPKTLDENSYQTCLNAIHKADFFVLLIGARKGGWYDEKTRVSITHMEYREALKCYQTTGKPKIAIFVRQNLWDIREDRAALLRYIEEDEESVRELDCAAKKRLASHPSRFANNAEAAFDFLKEVGQVEQMNAAASGCAVLPKANWIHLFSQFADIASALRVAFGITMDVERKILVENLRTELLQNLCHLMTKGANSGIIALSEWAKSSQQKITSSYVEESVLQISDLVRLATFELIASSLPNLLSTRFLEQAAKSGFFMNFDADTGQYTSTNEHRAVLELVDLISSLSGLAKAAQRISLYWTEQNLRGRPRSQQISVPNAQIAGVLGEANVVKRVIDLSVILVQFLSGNPQSSDISENWCLAPFADEAKKIMDEKVSFEEITCWLNAKVTPPNVASK